MTVEEAYEKAAQECPSCPKCGGVTHVDLDGFWCPRCWPAADAIAGFVPAGVDGNERQMRALHLYQALCALRVRFGRAKLDV